MKCTPEYNDETRRLIMQARELRRVARGAEAGDFGEAIRAKANEVIDAGEHDPQKVVDAAHEFINQHAPHEKGEVASAIAESKPRTAKEANSVRADVIAEIRDLEHVNRGLEAAQAERTARAIAQKKRTLTNQVTDLSRQLAFATRDARDKGTPIDSPEITKIREQRDALKQEVDNLEPSPPATRPVDPNIAKNKAEQTRVGKRMDVLKEKIANRDAAPAAKKAKPQWDEKTTQMREEYKKLKEQHDALTPKAEPRDAGTVRDERTVKRLEKEVASLDEQIARGEADAKQGKLQGPEIERIAELKKERAEKQQILDQNTPSPEATRPLDPNIAKNKARQTQLRKRAAELTRQLNEKDFEPQPKQRRSKRIDTPETVALQTETNRLQAEVDREMRKIEVSNRGVFQKTWASFLDVFRAVILSGTATLAHLGSAAAQKLIFNPAEALVGQGLKRVPWFKERIYAHTEYEGGSFEDRILAEQAALKNTLNSAAFQEMWSKLKGDSNLKALIGAGAEAHPDARENWGEIMGTILSLPARIHGVIKTPAELNDFHRALTMYSIAERRRAEKAGMSAEEVDGHMKDQQTVAILQLKAYRKSRETILMQDNKVNDWLNEQFYRLQQGGPVSRVVAGGAEYLLPIKKVATNMVGGLTSYIAGALKTRMALKEIDRQVALGNRETNVLTGEEADQLARYMQRQAVGIPLMILAWVNAEAIGGMFHRGEKKKPGEPGFGEIDIGGDKTIAKEWTHSEIGQLMMVTADARRAYDAAGGGAAGVASAAHAGVADVLNSLPFMEGIRSVPEALDTAKGGERFLGKRLGAMVPPDLRKYAEAQDTETLPSGRVVKVDRKATTVLEGLMKNLPGQREKLKKSGYREE